MTRASSDFLIRSLINEPRIALGGKDRTRNDTQTQHEISQNDRQ